MEVATDTRWLFECSQQPTDTDFDDFKVTLVVDERDTVLTPIENASELCMMFPQLLAINTGGVIIRLALIVPLYLTSP
jgi:hypothetical protein